MHIATSVHAPYLEKLVKGLAARIPKERKVFDAFKEYGEFTDDQALAALKWGTSPEIRVEPLGPTKWGNTPDGADYFMLNEIMIVQFEDLNWAVDNVRDPYIRESERAVRRLEWKRLKDSAQLRIEALILHETVHWGDGKTYPGSSNEKYLHQDGLARRAGFEDRGHQFAHAAYGNRLSFTKGRNGRWFTDHEIVGWIGTVHLRDKEYGYWRPLASRGPAPVRPPKLTR